MTTPSRTDIEEFRGFCDRIGKRAAERGLTEEKLAELLADDTPYGKPNAGNSRPSIP